MPLTPVQQTILDNGNRLFSERSGLLLLWQEMAEHFYYDRAWFTSGRATGQEYAQQAFSSDGALYRREMGNLFQSMMRPPDFYEVKAADEDRNKVGDARQWLQDATGFMRKVMYHQQSRFHPTTVLTDHDFVTFVSNGFQN